MQLTCARVADLDGGAVGSGGGGTAAIGTADGFDGQMVNGHRILSVWFWRRRPRANEVCISAPLLSHRDLSGQVSAAIDTGMYTQI